MVVNLLERTLKTWAKRFAMSDAVRIVVPLTEAMVTLADCLRSSVMLLAALITIVLI